MPQCAEIGWQQRERKTWTVRQTRLWLASYSRTVFVSLFMGFSPLFYFARRYILRAAVRYIPLTWSVNTHEPTVSLRQRQVLSLWFGSQRLSRMLTPLDGNCFFCSLLYHVAQLSSRCLCTVNNFLSHQYKMWFRLVYLPNDIASPRHCLNKRQDTKQYKDKTTLLPEIGVCCFFFSRASIARKQYLFVFSLDERRPCIEGSLPLLLKRERRGPRKTR